MQKNSTKELKYDFSLDGFNVKDFYNTEATLTFTMIAYNLMALFRTFVLQEKTQKNYPYSDKEHLLLAPTFKK